VILPTRRKARLSDFDLDAEVAVAAHDAEGREALLRYFLRPPLSHDRLRYLPSKAGGAVILQLKKPWQDRTTHVELTPSAFLARLASLVPRPKKNTSLYYGVLAAHAKDREKIVSKTKRKATRRQDSSWAALMKHSFGLDVLGCPTAGCKGRLTRPCHLRPRRGEAAAPVLADVQRPHPRPPCQRPTRALDRGLRLLSGRGREPGW
jgi:hypothetical protein